MAEEIGGPECQDGLTEIHPDWRELVKELIPPDVQEDEMWHMGQGLKRPPLGTKDGALYAQTESVTGEYREYAGRLIWYVHRNWVRHEIREEDGEMPEMPLI